MKQVVTISEIRSARAALSSPVGFVPTMGYLHPGHLSLVKRAREECANVVVSIFVNPTQFGPQEDLQTYPGDIARDLALLAEERIDLVWLPRQEDMYPAGYQTWVTVEEVTQRLEGAYRPGHFRGVATVVAKLLNCAQPDKTYFGQKDAQQVIVIRRMVQDLKIPGEIIVCPTVREPDGLAMSSRNSYLDVEERRATGSRPLGGDSMTTRDISRLWSSLGYSPGRASYERFLVRRREGDHGKRAFKRPDGKDS